MCWAGCITVSSLLKYKPVLCGYENTLKIMQNIGDFNLSNPERIQNINLYFLPSNFVRWAPFQEIPAKISKT